MVASGKRESASRKFRCRPMPGEIPALALQLRQFIRTADREQRFSRQRKSKWTAGSNIFRFQLKFIVQIAQTDRLQVENSADCENPGHSRFIGHHGRKMPPCRPACNDDPGSVEPERVGIFPQPVQEILNLPDDPGQILFRRQCIYPGSATEIP